MKWQSPAHALKHGEVFRQGKHHRQAYRVIEHKPASPARQDLQSVARYSPSQNPFPTFLANRPTAALYAHPMVLAPNHNYHKFEPSNKDYRRPWDQRYILS